MVGPDHSSGGSFPIHWVRDRFPALRRSIGDLPAIFLDGPGGTQVPEHVIEAVGHYYRDTNSNLGGSFATSRATGEIVDAARSALAEFLNATSAPEGGLSGNRAERSNLGLGIVPASCRSAAERPTSSNVA